MNADRPWHSGSARQERPLPPALSPRGRGATRRSDGRTRAPGWARVTRLLAAFLSLSVLGGTGYAWASYEHFTSGVQQVDAIPGAAPGHADADGPAMNILLVGDDHRPSNATPQELNEISTFPDGGGTNTDTMMVLHLPDGAGAPTVISLPRDSWVDIPGYGKNKLNAAFAFGAAQGGDSAGMRLLIQTVQNVTGLTIDHFVRVSLLGFYDIANVLGPIQVCLNQRAVDPYSGTDLPAGVSTLNAKQALSFVRQRHGLLRGDLDREVRQQYFLSTELHKILSAGTLLNPAKTQALLGAVSSAIETDTGFDLLGLAGRFANLSADKVSYATLPVSGTPTIKDASGNDVSIVQLDTAAIPGFVDGILNGTPAGTGAAAAPSSSPASVAAPVDPASVTVRVVNATGVTGLAATNTTALSRLGFHTLTPANGAAQRTTTITYPTGQQAQAQAVATHVPGATLQESAAASVITLTLGSDGVRVGQAIAAAAPAATPPSTGSTSFTTASCIN